MHPHTAIAHFRAYLQRRNYARHTVESYTLDLQLFLAAIDRPLATVSFRDVERFLEEQHQQGLAATTIHRRLHAVKHLFDFLLEQRLVAGNPVKPSHFPRLGRPLPKGLSEKNKAVWNSSGRCSQDLLCLSLKWKIAFGP